MTDTPLAPLSSGVTPIFMHIEHTGGSTLNQVIARQYAPYERFEFYHLGQGVVTKFMALPEEERRRFKLIYGHLYYGIHRHVPGASRYLTVMRHPVDRIIASYTFLLRKSNNRRHDIYKTDGVSWQDHLAKRRDEIRQISRIVGGDDELLRKRRIQALPENALETAIAHLENDFAMIGLQDRYDESLLMMRHVLNWQKPVAYIRKNVTSKRITLADLPPEDRVLIEKAAEIEMPLYEYAVKRFEAQVAAYPGDLERDLAQLRKDNGRYASGVESVERLKAPFRALKQAFGRVFKPQKS